MTILFILLYVIAVATLHLDANTKNRILIIICAILVWLIGSRDINWPDTIVYVMSFNQSPTLFHLNEYSSPLGYTEMGYFYLGALIKMLSNSWRFYLFVMAILSIFLLYKNLNKYCIYPLLGLCVYVGRFLLNRDMVQMRSSLAILLIIWGLQYVYKKRLIPFLLIVFLAYSFHRMALIALPFYFINLLKIKKVHIIISILIAFLLSQVAAEGISDYVDDWSTDLQYETYTQNEYVEQSLKLANPMIYFQLAILILFTFLEERIKNFEPYYYTLRNGYLYSTLILILFCNYTALSGRTSTMFATCEIFIIPLIAAFLSTKIKYLFLIGIGATLLYFFLTKYTDALIQLQSI